MAIAANCCLHLPLPTPQASPTNHSSKTQLITPNKGPWRSQVGAACITIGLALTSQTCQAQALALALTLTTHPNFTQQSSPPAVVEQSQVLRWSDKRSCPPWLINSFELTVPENLPRLRTHRRWEPAGLGSGPDHIDRYSSSSVRVIAKANPRCFSM